MLTTERKKERERDTLEKALAHIQTGILTVQVGIFMAVSEGPDKSLEN